MVPSQWCQHKAGPVACRDLLIIHVARESHGEPAWPCPARHALVRRQEPTNGPPGTICVVLPTQLFSESQAAVSLLSCDIFFLGFVFSVPFRFLRDVIAMAIVRTIGLSHCGVGLLGLLFQERGMKMKYKSLVVLFFSFDLIFLL